MKDLFTSVILFIVGAIVAFITCNMILPAIDDFKFNIVNVDSSASLAEPDIEIFNYRAVNPTVQVYVGDSVDSVDSVDSEDSGDSENGPAD